MQPFPRTGIRVSSGRVNIAAAATPTLVHTIPAGRTAIIRKIIWSEMAGLAGDLQIGHGAGAAWVQDMPNIDAPANMLGTLEQGEIPAVEFRPHTAGLTDQQIYARTTASTNLDIQVEVEELGA